MNDTGAAKAPAHLWIVGAVSLIWNCYGAYDYVMSELRDADYLANFPPEMVDLLDRFPVWATAVWAVGVWASVAGSILLLLRSRFAAPAFALSFVGVAISFAYQATLDLPEALTGGIYAILPYVVLALVIAQWWYARWMTRQGVLR